MRAPPHGLPAPCRFSGMGASYRLADADTRARESAPRARAGTARPCAPPFLEEPRCRSAPIRPLVR
ncbi:hypothetical protein A8H27_06650 [Burkholderia cenocepacia]|nr:hypothetical protein A8H29_07565 [Burkholderia cenocepacia]PNF08721.1 hypothetical protein A8H27_06650 [Burkholderia cenocepacia]RSC41267.1 hypothetical protein EGT44_21750 [Burkholderia cenocepacia]HDR9874298.1 hypothetical protein [Burkholderia cenocepacia]HDR9876253.1 hypothetical protein [Burkholderia cenocepacia]